MYSPAMIQTLVEQYSRINTIDPVGQGCAKLCKLLDAMPQEGLKQLAAANIKFVSGLARNRIK